MKFIALAYIYQLAKFGDFTSCGSKNIFMLIIKHATSQSHPKPTKTTHNQQKIPKTTHNHIHKHQKPPAATQNQPKSPKTIHKHQ